MGVEQFVVILHTTDLLPGNGRRRPHRRDFVLFTFADDARNGQADPQGALAPSQPGQVVIVGCDEYGRNESDSSGMVKPRASDHVRSQTLAFSTLSKKTRSSPIVSKSTLSDSRDTDNCATAFSGMTTAIRLKPAAIALGTQSVSVHT